MTHSSYFPVPSFLTVVRAFAATLALLAVSVAGFAQETTSGVRGTISGPDGAPAEGATVTVVDQRTGTTRSAVTSGSGQFSVSGLRVGGPYTIGIQSSQYAPQSITDVYLGLGDTFTFDLALGAAAVEEIIITASAMQSAQVALGPSTTFDFQTLQEAPAINRDLADIVRLDPRVYVDEADVAGLQCAGASSRFNSLTVDGVKMNDNFGLNRNGYPTERMPFPYDAIQEVSVELAPFDVQYGGFTACNFNAVTKSGTNEFHGSVFYDYTDDSLSGDTLEGDPIDLGSYDETRYGVAFGGPILQDKLFFFAAYEKLDGANTYSSGPAGTNVGAPVPGTSVAQTDEIARISREIYGYEPGGFETSLPVDDEKYLIKLDWEINDSHRAALTYNYNDGFNMAVSDSSTTQLEFSNHRYERGAELKATALQLFSNWNDKFSTEIRAGKGELDNRQIPRGGVDFGEVQITTWNDDDNDGIFSQATVYLGADDSRHANKLTYDATNYKIAGSYSLDDHVVTGGWERDEFDVFNLFIQEAELELRFVGSAACGPTNPNGCIHMYEAGVPERVIYENAAPSNIKADAAANFGYEINSLYLQDEFPIADGNVTVVAGMRYDWYSSEDLPRANPLFEQRYGYTNAKNFDGESLMQPRIGVTWDVSDTLRLRAGTGLYSGGNPNVWLSNNYSNDGITQVERTDFTLNDANPCGAMVRLPDGSADPNAAPCPNTLFTIPTEGDGRAIYDIPTGLYDAVASGTTDSGVNAIAPGFKIPSQWKFNIGGNWTFDLGGLGEGYELAADLIFTRSENSAITKDAALLQIGTALDGRPIYKSVNRLDPDCLTAPATAACSGRGQQDFVLENVSGPDSEATVFSISLSKSHEIGIDWALAYAYTDSTDVSPMTSSTAGSNFGNIAVSDPNNPTLADSNYLVPHRFTGRFSFRKEFFGDNYTRFTVFGSANEGIPFSHVYASGGAAVFGDSSFTFRHLLYVPTGPTDPVVNFGPNFDQDAFFDYINSSGLAKYAGSIAPRNAFYSDWWTKFDVRIEQELPGFGEDHHFAAFMMIENVGNLISDGHGIHREQAFPRTEESVELTVNQATGQLNYNLFVEPGGQQVSQDASLWEIRFGVRYDF